MSKLKLTVLREERGWTKTELSYRSKVQPADISRIENRRMKPYDAQLRKLAKALGVADASTLMDEVEYTLKAK